MFMCIRKPKKAKSHQAKAGSQRETAKATPGQNVTSHTNNEDSLLKKARESKNYMFYSNRMSSSPKGDFVDNILASWYGQWQLLDDNTGYVCSLQLSISEQICC